MSYGVHTLYSYVSTTGYDVPSHVLHTHLTVGDVTSLSSIPKMHAQIGFFVASWHSYIMQDPNTYISHFHSTYWTYLPRLVYSRRVLWRLGTSFRNKDSAIVKSEVCKWQGDAQCCALPDTDSTSCIRLWKSLLHSIGRGFSWQWLRRLMSSGMWRL
jgi:hypothetical protein